MGSKYGGRYGAVFCNIYNLDVNIEFDKNIININDDRETNNLFDIVI